MGNVNCCYKKKQIDNDFNVEPIFAFDGHKQHLYIKESIKQTIKKLFIKEEKINCEENKQNSERDLVKKTSYKSLYITEEKKLEFDYFSNTKNDWRDYIIKYEEEKASKNFMKLVNHITFRKEQKLFYSKFLEDLNNARCDLLGFSQKLLYYFKNFDFIENKINKINDSNMKEIFSRTKESFKEASEFFGDLYEEKMKEEEDNLNELIEIDDIKLPIPSDFEELIGNRYLKKFEKRFVKRFRRMFKIKKIKCSIVHDDPDISFLLLITNYDKKKFTFLFEEKSIYIGIDFKENFDGTNLLSLVLASDL